MSLLKKASIITTPTAYAEDYLYSIKPALSLGAEEITNGNFSVSGTINATSYSLGFASSDTGGTFTISNGQVTLARVNGSTRLRGTNGVDSLNFLTSGKKYRLVYNVISNNGASAFYYYNGSTGVAAPSTVGQHTIDYTSAGTQFYLETQNNGSNITLDGISIKEVTDADFDFDRNSTGTRVNEDYLIEDVPYNLLRYTEAISTDFGVTDVTLTDNYSLSASGTQTSTRAQLTNLGQSRAFNTVTSSVVSGQSYTFSCHYKGTQGQTVYINALPVGGTEVSKEITLNGGWQRESVTFTAGSSSNYVYFVDSRKGGTATDFEVWGVQLVKGDQPKEYLKTTDRLDIPRIDYTNGEPSILLEPQRQNLITYSQDISQWGNARTTDTANQITSPDGLNNGTLVEQQSGQTNAGSIFISVSGLSNGTTYTTSIYAKKKDKDYIVAYDANTNRTYFDLDEGYVETLGSGVTAEIISMPNGWYRCVATFTYSLSPTATNVGWYLGDTDNSATVTDSGGVYVYGAQFEAGSYATSLIHTSGSTVTRSADRADNAGNTDLINSTEGVFYLQFAALTGAGSFDDLSLSDGTQNNKVQLFYRATDKINARVTVGGVNVFDHIYQSTDMTQFEKVAIKWKLNDFSMYVDGREVDSDSSGATFSANTLNVIKINDNNISDYVGKIKCLAVFKEALSDTELEKLTGYNNHELYMNYYNRLSYLGLVEEYNVESDINNYIL